MSEMIERMARAFTAALEETHQMTWLFVGKDGLVDQIDGWIDTKDLMGAVLKSMIEPTDAMLHAGAMALDHPSLYMGGPSAQSKRNAKRCFEAMVLMALEK